MRSLLGVVALLGSSAAPPACAPAPEADLAAIYNTPASEIGHARTPVVVIPGILGSKLTDSSTGTKVWGSFTFGAADADTPDGANLMALPMARGVPLTELRDDVYASDVLDVVVADVGLFRGLEIAAYVDLMKTLAAGRYRDQMLGESGAVDYGGEHYTCFQVPYDWRRSIPDAARELDAIIRQAMITARFELDLPPEIPLKVDVVAHSMGGLVLRYYLRYGTAPLPEDGSLPELTWAGARNVRKAVLVGTPSAGSVLALKQLVEGMNLNPLFPNYRPALLGTMPAVFQLLPRARHNTVVDAQTREPIDVFDIGTWERYEWGLLAPGQDRVLRWLLPEAQTREEREAIARDHLDKSLRAAAQFHRAIDLPASPPDGLELFLFAGDSEDTPGVLGVDGRGRIRILESVPGDETVTRASALMDERFGGEYTPGLRSPVDWHRVQFVFADHLGLTRAATFTDNLLFILLEDDPQPVLRTKSDPTQTGTTQ
ncbi:MAG: esterase/lipase family protein [Phycisphaerales bacterium JB040]